MQSEQDVSEAVDLSDIQEFIVTFGVQYGRQFGDPEHRFGLHGDEYVIIEAPNETIAREVAFAIFGQQWSRLYPRDGYAEASLSQYYPVGESIRIAWIDRKKRHTEAVAKLENPDAALIERAHEALMVANKLSGFSAPEVHAEAHADVLAALGELLEMFSRPAEPATEQQLDKIITAAVDMDQEGRASYPSAEEMAAKYPLLPEPSSDEDKA